MSTTSPLPRWSFAALFPSVTSAAYTDRADALVRRIASLVGYCDEWGIGGDAQIPADVVPEVFDRIATDLDAALDEAETLRGALYAIVSVDSGDTAAQAALSDLLQRTVPLGKLAPRFQAWIGSIDLAALLARSEVARAREHALRRAVVESRHLMDPSQEDLARDLHLSGGSAWERLHGDVTSRLSVPFHLDGAEVDLPLSRLRSLREHPDRDVRARAWEAETRLWETEATPVVAALNGVKGETITLATRRGWPDVIDVSLHLSAIDRDVLGAMMGAAREAYPMFRRYMHAKARHLGLERLAWYDVDAPLGDASTAWTWEAATAYITAQFDRYSPAMGDLARRSFSEPWIDAEPRSGKVGGAYCMWLTNDQSRIMMNFEPNYGGVITLAHELGHAYHNWTLRDRTPMQRDLPMTLAETASTFCETLVRSGALETAGDHDALLILDGFIGTALAVVIDISSRYQFEQAVIDTRRTRDLSAPELCEIMRQAQLDTYGDGLDPEGLFPWAWAAKPHYYSVGWPFYNYPYMFGLLFGLGLYAIYQREPDTFRDAYDQLLGGSGMADARTLARGFGIDLADAAFWRASLDVVGADIDRAIGLMERLARA